MRASATFGLGALLLFVTTSVTIAQKKDENKVRFFARSPNELESDSVGNVQQKRLPDRIELQKIVSGVKNFTLAKVTKLKGDGADAGAGQYAIFHVIYGKDDVTHLLYFRNAVPKEGRLTNIKRIGTFTAEIREGNNDPDKDEFYYYEATLTKVKK